MACTCIFPRQEVNLDFMRNSIHLDSSEEYVGLFALTVIVREKELEYRLVANFVKHMMVESKIYVKTTNMSLTGSTQQKLWHPSAHDNDPISIFS
jgi:hypothetical protein